MNGEELVKSIAFWVEKRHGENPEAKGVASDIQAINEGYMSEKEAGAMIVDLITMVAEEN